MPPQAWRASTVDASCGVADGVVGGPVVHATELEPDVVEPCSHGRHERGRSGCARNEDLVLRARRKAAQQRAQSASASGSRVLET